MSFKKAICLIYILFGSAAAQTFLNDYIDLNNPENLYISRQWTSREGLSQNSVLSVTQTDDGWIWAGTSDGLLKFDGMKFIEYNVENLPGLTSNRIVSNYYDSNGRLWVGTEHGGLFLIKEDSAVSMSKKHNLPKAIYSRFVETSDGILYIGSDLGLFKFDSVTFEQIELNTQPADESVSSLAVDSNDNIYISLSTQGGFYVLKKSSITNVRQLKERFIHALIVDRKETLWIGTSTGLYYAENCDLTSIKKYDKLGRVHIIAMQMDSRDNLWIGTYFNGLKVLYIDEVYPFRHKNLNGAKVNCIYEDEENNIWIGTISDGLFLLKNRFLYSIGEENGIKEDIIYPIIREKNGAIIAGSNCGGVYVLDRGKISNHILYSSGINSCVWSLLQTGDGTIYGGTYGTGAFVLKNNELKSYDIGIGGYVAVSSITADNKNNLWFGTSKGLFKIDSRGSRIRFTTSDGLANIFVQTVYNDSKGRLWVGTVKGMSLSANGSLSVINDPEVKDKYIRTVYEDTEGDLWFGTYGQGLIHYDGENFSSITEEDGLYDNVVSAILEDDSGFMWMTSNRGLFRNSRQELLELAYGEISAIYSVSYGENHGLPTNEFNGGGSPSGLKLNDGTLWFPTIKGIVVVDLTRLKVNNEPPKTSVISFSVDGKEQDLSERIVIPPDYTGVEIEYTAINFSDPQNLKFRHKIEGLDEEYSDVTESRTLYFKKLPAGEYTFKVKAGNSDGVWNISPVEIRFTIEEHFYETTTFLILVFLAAAFAAGVFTYFRIRKYRTSEKQLQMLVDEKTKSLQVEKEKTEEALKIAEDSRSKLNDQKKELQTLNRSKDRFFSILGHDLKNPFVSILGFAEVLLEDFEILDEKTKRKYIEEIFKSSKTTHFLLENILNWAKSQQGRIKYSPESIQLMMCVEDNLAVVRAAAVKKNIKVKNNVPEGLSIYADLDMINTVFRNLFTNAVKFSHTDGEIDIEAKERNGFVEIYIKDYGVGIPESDIPSLFNYSSLSIRKGTNEEKGTGLGLILSREFIEKNNGEVKVESIEGEGTTLIVKLPSDDSAIENNT